MAKKKRFGKKSKNKKKASREDDALLRLSYLWSASHLLVTSDPELSRFYTSTVTRVGQRINLPLETESIKRNLCKKCSALLIPGAPGEKCVTRVRVAPRREKHLVATCGNCGAFRRFGARYPRPCRKSKGNSPIPHKSG